MTFKKGDIVTVYCSRFNGEPAIEGRATIVGPGHVSNQYTVRFEGARAPCRRFVFAGDAQDDPESYLAQARLVEPARQPAWSAPAKSINRGGGPMDEPTDTHISISTLKAERGWTDRLIKTFLGEPDRTAPNPVYSKAGAPMRLYAMRRIEAAEATESFAAERAKTDRRRIACAKAVVTKTSTIASAMDAAEITIKAGRTRGQIRELAEQTHGGNYAGDPGDFQFNNKVAVNCIRHNLTNYEELWAICNRGKTGQGAYDRLRARVDELIRKTYPEYFD
jgi:hypothetical protein